MARSSPPPVASGSKRRSTGGRPAREEISLVSDSSDDGRPVNQRQILSRGNAKRKSMAELPSSSEGDDDYSRKAAPASKKGKGRATAPRASTASARSKRAKTESSDANFEATDDDDDDMSLDVGTDADEDDRSLDTRMDDAVSLASSASSKKPAAVKPKTQGKSKAVSKPVQDDADDADKYAKDKDGNFKLDRDGNKIKKVVDPADLVDIDDLHELHKGEKVTPFVYIPGAPTKDHSARHARLKAAKAEVEKRKAARKTAKTNKLKAKAEAEGKIYVEASKEKKEDTVPEDGQPVEPDSEDDGQEDAYDSDDDPEEVRKAAETGDKLPPISNIEEIFADLTSRADGLKELVDSLDGKPLKIATMCSGTESPILALGLIAEALWVKYGVELKFKHDFSCEIEPYKQAYIERNFSPPVLFADVTELGNDYAHNAYGAKVAVPLEGFHMLIAGTSCVDFSGLNVKKKTISEKGESGRTWKGMLDWCRKAKPMIVILENVISAPWPKMVDDFEEIGYAAHASKFDTKKYYIPHTRSRGYQVCFRNPSWDPWQPNKTSIADELPWQWNTLVKQLERPASSSLEAFLLHSDDPRIHQARLDLSKKTKLALDLAQRATTDWARCQSRHEKARYEEGLGDKRPATNWTEGGVPQLKDGSWGDWAPTQTERVLDLTDINTLRQAKLGIDAEYKAFVWNLSQNVDRTTGSNATAISPCLTPNMIAFLTTRGGPVVGLEALSLQGLPIEKLLLTRESEDQLANLAGNAMTSTVVGACMIAALITAKPLFEHARREESKKKSGKITAIEDEDEEMAELPKAVTVVGVDELEVRPFDMADTTEIAIPTLLEHAARSARHCNCEGQSDLVAPETQILCCEACGHMVCKNCAGRPTHEYKPSTTSSERIEPRVFGDQLRAMIPTRVTFAGVDDNVMDAVRSLAQTERRVTINDNDWSLFKTSVLAALSPESEYRFKWIRRRDTWALQMGLGEQAYLQLDLDSVAPTWFAFVQPERTDGNKARRRELLQPPAARLKLDRMGSSVLAGEWEISLPSTNTFAITIEGRGEPQRSWKNMLGLVDFQNEHVHPTIDVLVPAESKHLLDVDVSGEYHLHFNCGTAQSSLYIRPASADGPSISFFLDPTRSGEPDKDSFVFASRSDRLEYGEQRTIYASIDPKWRPIQTLTSAETTCSVVGTWVAAPGVVLASLQSALAVADEASGTVAAPVATVSLPPATLDLKLHADSCSTAAAVLAVSVKFVHPEREAKLWSVDGWNQIDLRLKAKELQDNTAWLTERLPELRTFADWLPIEYGSVVEASANTCCTRCAPVGPEVGWVVKGAKVVPREDPAEAGRHEVALKNRPAPFVIQTRLDGQTAKMEVAINVTSLLHRALSALPSKPDASHELSWRITPNHPSVESSVYISRQFVLPSNKNDPTCPQPPSFRKNGMALRPEQLRSFAWAMRQERPEADHTFEEEEIAEATLAPMGWRAEGRASRKVLVRGGVIADAVGYGKTAISLAVIDASRKLPTLESLNEKPHGKLYSKATLIVVPPHLMDQWKEEVVKFLGKSVTIKVVKDFRGLSTATIREIQEVGILIIASNVFSSPRFWATLGEFSTVGDVPTGKDASRYFLDRFKDCRDGAQKQMDLLTTKPEIGVASKNVRQVHQNIVDGIKQSEKARKDAAANRHSMVRIGEKKLSGAAYDAFYNQHEDIESDDEDDVKTADAKRTKRAARAKAIEKGTYRPPAAPKARTPIPFALDDARTDWRNMKCPPIYAFMFERLIVDEFTYVAGRARSAIKELSAHASWVLSGTPNIQDFNEINDIADLLHVHLGVPADLTASKTATKDKTSAEMFHSYRETHTQAWRAQRDEVGQRFLDGFVRQNQAEIDEIRMEQHLVRITLPAAEKALYMELEHHLNTMDAPGVKMTSLSFKNVKSTAAKSVQDRTERLKKATEDAKDIRECLIRRSCGFEPPLEELPPVVAKPKPPPRKAGDPPAPKVKREPKVVAKPITNPDGSALTPTQVCDLIASERKKQLSDCVADIRLTLKYAIELFNALSWEEGEAANTKFAGWIRETYRMGEGDPNTLATFRKMFADFGVSADGTVGKNVPLTREEAALGWKKGEKTDFAKVLATVTAGKAQAATGAMVDSAKWDLSEKTHLLKRLSRELRARNRSYRFFEGIRRAQKIGPDLKFVCLACGESNSPETISSSCGHTACWKCQKAKARLAEACPIEGCTQALGRNQLYKVIDFDRDGESGEYGAKMVELIRIVKEVATPKNESVLVFAQFRLIDTVQAALEKAGVHVTVIGKGTATKQSKTVSDFQKKNSGQTSVLVLDTAAASAAGANLTQANHTIFFHPIHVPSQYQYDSTNTQAIGRTRRFGQTRTVHIWRLLAKETIDDTIYRERTKHVFPEDEDRFNDQNDVPAKKEVRAVVDGENVLAMIDEDDPAAAPPPSHAPATIIAIDEDVEDLPDLERNDDAALEAAQEADIALDATMDDRDARELAEFSDVAVPDEDEPEVAIDEGHSTRDTSTSATGSAPPPGTPTDEAEGDDKAMEVDDSAAPPDAAVEKPEVGEFDDIDMEAFADDIAAEGLA